MSSDPAYEALMPCICGSDRTDEEGGGGPGPYWLTCMSCGRSTYSHPTLVEAHAAWNTGEHDTEHDE